MGWENVLREEAYSVLVGTEAALGTEALSFIGVDCQMPQVTYEAAISEGRRSMRSRGAGTKRFVGRVWPVLRFRFPVCGQLDGYDFTSHTPALQGQCKLIGGLGGSTTVAYAASEVTATDADTWSLASSSPGVGCLVAAGVSSVVGTGFVKSVAGLAPATVQLFEDTGAAVGAGRTLFPSRTYYPAAAARTSLSVRICGEDSGHERKFLGGVQRDVRYSFDEASQLWCEVEIVFYGGEPAVRTTSGGLQAVTDTLFLEPLYGRAGGRFVIASDLFTDLADGTIDADGTCDVRDFTWGYSIPHYPVMCPTRLHGVSDVRCGPEVFGCSFTLPDIDSFEVGGEHFGEQALRELGSFSASLYLGDTPGRGLAVNMPALHPTAWPEVVFVDQVKHRRFTCETGDYAGDGASTAAGNKVYREAWF